MRQSPMLLAAFIEYVGLDDASLERETARLTPADSLNSTSRKPPPMRVWTKFRQLLTAMSLRVASWLVPKPKEPPDDGPRPH